MKVNSTHTAHPLIEANIIKPLKARAADALDTVVRHEEVLLPAHEEVLTVEVVFEGEGRGVFGGLGERAPGGEAGPVLEVDFLAAVPARIGGAEEMFRADDFAFEKGC